MKFLCAIRITQKIQVKREIKMSFGESLQKIAKFDPQGYFNVRKTYQIRFFAEFGLKIDPQI